MPITDVDLDRTERAYWPLAPGATDEHRAHFLDRAAEFAQMREEGYTPLGDGWFRPIS